MNKDNFIVREYGDNLSGWVTSGHKTVKFEEKENGVFLSEKFKVKKNAVKYADSVCQSITVKNISHGEVCLKQVSSAFIDEIGEGGIIPWHDDRRFVIHYCHNAWQGEAQWRHLTLSEAGLYYSSNHVCANAFVLRSVGNQSTAVYYPVLFLEDKELGKTWFFETECAWNWYMEIGTDNNNTLYAEINSAFCNNDGWCKTLLPDEEYTSSECIYGCTNGGFEEAAAALIKCKRMRKERKFDTIPVVFNDYMNCIWTKTLSKTLKPIVDAAAKAGCEVFCMDAGWYRDMTDEEKLGDWQPENARFDGGFDEMIKYISSKGMQPGVWLEIDSITENSDFFANNKDCLLKKCGHFAGGGGRYLADFTQSEVRNRFMKIFDMLYSKGVRFIKNDYNQTSGIGYDGGSEKLRECSEAFNGFIDEVCEKYPDLIIENCGSGAMRADGETMKHFQMFSTSDQEMYYNNPSIVSGTQAYSAPEKCGIWSYPYPLKYDNLSESYDEYFNGECISKYKNGEETSFNMINSMFGVMYLSGHIEYADEKNFNLIADGVELYKKNRDFIKEAYPIYPCGTINMEKQGFFCYGLKTDKKIMLAVWRINSSNSTEMFDLSSYTGEKASAKVIYPEKLQTRYHFVGGRLTVELKEQMSARLFEITL